MEGSGLGIDIKLMLAQTINFLLFLFLFSKFIAPHFFKFIQKEKKDEEERRKIGEDLEKQKQKQQDVYNETVKEAKVQATVIVREAELLAKKQREKLLSEATTDAHEVREKAKKQLESERIGMMGEMRTHIIKTSQSLVETVLKDSISEKEQALIMKSLVKKLSNKEKV